MTRFSANLGYLWTELSLPQAIHAAKSAGFDAVECHWPYDTPTTEVAAALDATGLPMIGLNTSPGAEGEVGLAALPGREAEARAAIDQAAAYALAVGARAVHVMAGRAQGAQAEQAFLANLRYALACAERSGLLILIEPLNRHDMPGYFLETTRQAEALIAKLGHPSLKLMFDCYHVARTEGDVIDRLTALIDIVGHIQFAGVPARGAPDQGDVEYAKVFQAIAALGWAAPLGAEYRPNGATERSLGWMTRLTDN